MLAFGQTKNNIEKLRRVLKRMDFFDSRPMRSEKQFQQQKLRQYHNQILLPILNHILIDFSTDIYIEILDKLPNLKYKDDKGFIEDVIWVARQFYKVSVTLTPQQFLSDKYFDKKLQFVANLALAVLERSQAFKKNKKDKKDYSQVLKKDNTEFDTHQVSNQFDDFQEEVPVAITAVPLKIEFHQLNKLQNPQQTKSNFSKPFQQSKAYNSKTVNKNKFLVQGEQFEQNQIEEALEERHPTPVNHIRKPKDEPIQITQRVAKNKGNTQFFHDIENSRLQGNLDDQDNIYRKFRLDEQKNIIPSKHSQQIHKQIANQNKGKTRQVKHIQDGQKMPERENNYVSRNQFNQLVNLIKVVSETVNDISAKFGDLQQSVGCQINNMNARIMLLQSSVRLLKDNL